MKEKIKILCEKITKESQERLVEQDLGCQCNLDNAVAYNKDGQKYIKINVGSCGKYMIDKKTGEIFGIKAYGVIHRGHKYGTLDTINDFYWGYYKAYRLSQSSKR